ncbi:hypothetical protein EMPS_11016 [Entomortierella parvispora]|uniref:Golgi apparatus membrane protein TVP38 n=1 Tax=Entomortierella parvispora TaxID=205924 RepID=A0A9P3HL39_9FUNG|nr:hypothetical protein EMPS_11016 [Entomortierella parvispora]
MSSFVGSTSTATAAALGRFHSGSSSSSNVSSSTSASTTRQRSSSFTSQIAHANIVKNSSSLASASSRKFSITPETLNKGLFQDEGNPLLVPQRDLSLPSSSFSSLESATALARAHDRINLVPATDNLYANNNSHHTQGYMPPPSPIDLNNDGPNQESAPTICTGRSRSSTLTNTSTDAVDVAAAVISTQFDHVMRPRRPSLVSRASGPMTLVAPSAATTGGHTVGISSRPSYPPEPLLPQHHESGLDMNNNNNNSSSNNALDSKSSSTVITTAAESPQMGFLPRILVLVGLFGMSLGGLYMLAQVLPPLSLPKSIDDVKVDAEILQEFATATLEGWLRTFWVFSAVYIWKQCFGIPGSAFLNILAGALYGPWFGTLLTSLLTTLGSVLAYFMSFFLMEPIMNRYASSKLDQMRAQIEKKTMRSSSFGKRSTTEVMQASSSSSSTSISTVSVLTERPSVRLVGTGGTLRTRSSSFTVRRTDEANQQSGLPSYSYPLSQRDEIEVQENEGLLDETETDLSHLDSQGQQQQQQQQDVEEEDEEEDEEEGTSLFMQLLLIRLFPLTPYWFINLASPLVGVPVIPFMTSMFLGCMPYNYICAQAGAILGEIHELRDIYQQPWIMFQIALVLVLSFGGIWVSKRSKKQQLEKDQQRKNRKSRTSEEEETDDETTHSLLRPSATTFEQGETEREENRERVEMVEISHTHLVAPAPKNKKRESAIIDMTAYGY